MFKASRNLFLSFALSLGVCQYASASVNTIKIGFNLPLSGMFELVGNHSKNAAELIRKDLESAGGLQIGGKKYAVEFIYGDNQSNPTTASSLTINQVSQHRVLGIIGPLSSRQAIPVGQMANAFSTPMISPWSTSPVTTKDKPFVFRSCFIYTSQGPVITKFMAKEYNAKKAAVLFDVVSAYPRGMAKSFKEAFEQANGEGSVVSFEQFRTGDTDFRKQLKRIVDSGAQFIFTPQHYNEVPLIVNQANELGLTIPIIGSNSWAGGDLVGECGDACNGLFFTGNYAPGGATGINREFVEQYKNAYGEKPDEPAALTWDAVRALIEAIKKSGQITGNIIADRSSVRAALVNVKNFDGASGMMSFNETGTPTKCTMVVKIEKGIFTFHDSVCP